MKKYFFLALAAIVSLVFASCSEELSLFGQSEGDVDVTYTVSTQSVPGARATHDGDGAAANVNRYICEVWHETSDGLTLHKRVENVVGAGTKNTSFKLRLVSKQNYKVLFWADHAEVVGEGEVDGNSTTAADIYYDTKTAKGLQEVTLKKDESNNYVGNNDELDAFYAVEEITALNGTIDKTSDANHVILKRPFAQLNVITTDVDDIRKNAVSSTLNPNKIKMTVNAPTKFNVLTGEASAEEDIEYTAAVYYNISKVNKNDDLDGYSTSYAYCTLAMNYYFAPADEKAVETVKFVALNADKELVTPEFANIPLQRNYRTNIIGNLLTDAVNYHVEIDPIWTGEKDVNVATVTNIAAANEALKTVDNVIVTVPDDAATQDVILPEEKEGKLVAITIEGTVPAGAIITFKNEVTDKTPRSIAVIAPAGTKLNFENPTHVVVNGTVYESISGVFSANTLVISEGVTVNMLSPTQGKIEIHGTVNVLDLESSTAVFGKSENISEEMKAQIGNKLAENFIWKQNAAGSWDIISSDFYKDAQGVYHIKSSDGFKEFAAAVTGGTTFEGKTIVLDKDINFENAILAPIGNHSDNKPFKGTFNGNNKKLSNLTIQNVVGKQGVGLFGKVYEPCVIKDLTVENATIIGDKTVAGDRAIAYVGGIAGHGYAKIQNCIFKGDIYAGYQMGGIAGSGGFTIIGCTFEGNIVSERDWGLGGIIGNCQDGGAISGNTAKGTISAKNSNYCGLIAGGIIGCAIYTTYDVKNNYAAMSMTYDGKAFENVYPIVGVYNIDAPGTGNEDFAALLYTLTNNTWDKTISPKNSYDIMYDNENHNKTGYVINYGGATTQDIVE